ncbi:MAG: hypothetical protein NDP13_02315 [Crenarchaeota archaeon]|nr:hypothetical protein [Thermoproteota archaeon]MCR8453805.1 hypothetical protein [Thermoproteota archaeon]MCR8455644.1 hypothetical protein [Thermoproteota archaeon]MCR8462879.1 hypothetical protein [Thermoproteota archaeon]MCR8471382.1 hypothetical protein [Thermoproteota archaeon]
MVFTFSNIREILTMKLVGTEILSELGRNIYAVRFIGKLEDMREERSKIILTISDDKNKIQAVFLPRLAFGGANFEVKLQQGKVYVFYAHLEPQSKLCYIDFFAELDKQSQLRFLLGMFRTYFRLAFMGDKLAKS